MDTKRVALVVATAAEGKGETTASGYFLTGNLVLTARHAVTGSGVTLRVRSEVGGPLGEEHWAEANLVWSGGPTVDAALLRTKRAFGKWSPPEYVREPEAGSWTSHGFPSLAIDDNGDIKSWPLKGSFGVSGGMGRSALALTTDSISAERWETGWQGLSGAPIFTPDGGLRGVIVEAHRKLKNALVGLPMQALLDDVAFLPAATPSFLGDLPDEDEPWCLVVTSEGCGSSLVQEVEDVISGFGDKARFRELRPQPIELPVLRAVESFENWAASVTALAKADYVVADVTDFEPAVMLVLGVRAVLRRGVTVSVTRTDLSAHAQATPFNVRETRVLSYDDPKFFDNLYGAMRDGADSMDRDLNYLDLPAYHAVRTPRAETVGADEAKTPLVLCSFSDDYTPFYEAKLKNILRSRLKKSEPRRMLDLRSPRLVGQALYEQIRWTARCIVDWTEWRPNVFFEFGVRLACSAHDSFVLLDVEERARDVNTPDRPLRQQDLLATLFAPVRYERKNPRDKLGDPLKNWSEATGGSSWSMPETRVPSGGTFAVAQQSYVWKDDETLTAPHTEQQAGAERILGKDRYRQPVPLILFADNETFSAKLRDAARERWIAAWLYLDHLSGRRGENHDGVDTQLVTVARMTRRELASSAERRHVALRGEIADFLRRHRAASDDVRGLKERARDAREEGNWTVALEDLNKALDIVEEDTSPDPADRADIWGQIGGVERRWGLSAGPADRVTHLEASKNAYDAGFVYEKRLGSRAATTYNRVNRLVARVLVSSSVLDGVPYDGVRLDHELAQVERLISEQRTSSRVNAWTYCDLATAQLLRSRPVAGTLDDLDKLRPESFVYESHLDTLRPLAAVAGDLRPGLREAIERQERSMRSAPS